MHALAAPVEVGGERFVPGRAFVVPVDQPQGRLVKAAMERVTTFNDSLFYDVSSWTLPLAFGVRYGELKRGVHDLLGAPLQAVGPIGGLRGGRASFAYLIPWGQAYAPRALARLQQAGVHVRLAKEPFETAEGRFERGTLVVPVVQAHVEPEAVHQLIGEVAGAAGVMATHSGLTPAGPDLGSRGMPVLEAPHVAILSGEGTDAYSVGEAWHLLTERAGLPISLLDRDDLGDADLDRYTTVVVAGRFRGLDDLGVAKLKGWVGEGGTLIATEQAASWAVEHGFVELEVREAEDDTTDYAYEDVRTARGAQVVGGAVFEAELDATHPLAFGHGERVALFKSNALGFDPPAASGAGVARYAEAPLLSGYVSAENLDRLRGGAAIVGGRLGRGRVVVFDFDPNFRAFWWGTQGLLLNAVFFGGAF